MKKVLTFLLCLILSGCVTPSVENTTNPLTGEKICELKNNRLKAPQNFVAAWLELSAHENRQNASLISKIRGTLIVRRADKSYKFNHDDLIVFTIDKKSYKIHPTSVTNTPFSKVNSSTSAIPYGNRHLYIPIYNIESYTDTNYKFVIDKDFINLLHSSKEVMINLSSSLKEDKDSKDCIIFEEKNFKAIKSFDESCINTSSTYKG